MLKILLQILFTSFFKNNIWINSYHKRKVLYLWHTKKIFLRVGKVHFSAFNSITLQGVIIYYSAIRINVEACTLEINFRSILKTKSLRQLLSFRLDKINVLKIHSNVPSNHHNTSSNTYIKNKIDVLEKKYYPIFQKLLNNIFALRASIEMNQLVAFIGNIEIRSNSISLKKDGFSINTSLLITNKIYQDYLIKGTIDQSNRTLNISINNNNEIGINIDSYKYHFEFCNIYISEVFDELAKESAFHIELGINDIIVNNKNICSKRISIKNLEFDIEAKLSRNSFIITEDSSGVFEEIPFTFTFIHDSIDNDLLKAIFLIEIAPTDLLKSFPDFYNENIRSIKGEGRLLLQFEFIINITNLLEYYFDLQVLENDLKITDIRAFDLFYLNKAYANERSNNNDLIITPSENIGLGEINSKFLEILIFTEDPGFYKHNGVDLFFIGYALVSNISTRKFSRGGSTITMQLVRNLFLKHEKSILRKLEEVIIALLIENHFMISKNRLLELYLNIIEFAPNVYGLKHASEFYFSKHPRDLTITECIVITYIIPRPKHFHEALISKTPQLLINLPNYFEKLSNGLLTSKIINEDDYRKLDDVVKFSSNFGIIRLKSSIK